MTPDLDLDDPCCVGCGRLLLDEPGVTTMLLDGVDLVVVSFCVGCWAEEEP
jgi:hypothetical protein